MAGKTAVVANGGSRLGRDLVLALAESGLNLLITDPDRHAAERAANDAIELGRKAVGVGTNVLTERDATQVVQQAVKTFGAVDALVVNCSPTFARPIMELDDETWNRTLQEVVVAPFLLGKAMAQAWIQAGRGGRILHVSSIAGKYPYRNMAASSSAQASLTMLTQGMALEWGRHGITANEIQVGYTDSQVLADGDGSAAHLALIKRKLVAGRVGRGKDDVGALVAFLASGAAEYITGVSIPVAGGAFLQTA